MNPSTVHLTMNPALLPPDHIATFDAFRAQAALGRETSACLTAAVAAYLRHHPGMGRREALAAVHRILIEGGSPPSRQHAVLFQDVRRTR